MYASLALDKLLTKPFDTILDVGCGSGTHTNIFKQHNKQVTSTDWKAQFDGVVEGDYSSLVFNPHDAIWCSHVLEHQLNVNIFLRKIYNDLKEDGWLAITVPPLKNEIVGGHVTLWNAGLLVYNLVLAGFDCSEASIATYDYNCSVVVQKKSFTHPPLKYDNGDVEILSKWMPSFLKENVNGNIQQWNW